MTRHKNIQTWVVSFFAIFAVTGCINSAETIALRMTVGGVLRTYELSVDYLNNKSDLLADRDYVVLNVEYPNMQPCDRDSRALEKCMLIIVEAERKTTTGEYVTEQWKLRKQKENNGPAFDRYIGEENGYQIFEAEVGKRQKKTITTRIFVDKDGNYVADDGSRSSARIGGLAVEYGGAKNYGVSPRELHSWMIQFINIFQNNGLKGK